MPSSSTRSAFARTAVHAALVFAVLCVFTCVPRLARAAGSLALARGGGELPLERTDVDVDVAGSVVSATVTQRFKNPRPEPIEVVYTFPLPQRAAVDAMEMKIGSRVVQAKIARREEARRAYEQAIQQGQRAALLEQERPNIFTFTVGNVDANATIDVKLHYFEVAAFDHGTYELAIPTTIGPRFIPGTQLGGPQSGGGTKADTDRVPDASRISPAYGKTGVKLAIKVHLDAGSELDSVTSPSHATDTSRPSPRIADVRLKSDAEIPNRDFVFRWRLAAETLKPALFTHRPSDGEPGYVTLLLEPKHDIPDSEIAPRELFFLLDTSGSMFGAPLDAAKSAVLRAVDALGANDTFQIIDFADKASTFAPRPLPNTADNRAKAHEYLRRLSASGGTNQLAGIHAALSAAGDENRIRYVMFMTDGFIGNDTEVIAATRREIGRARIFSFGVGSSVNRYLLDEVAIAGRGHAEYLRPRNDDGKELVERFYRRIGRPYLTDIEIDWGGLQVTEARPTALPDLSAFEPLVLHARYLRAGDGIVTIRGKIGNQPFAKKVHVNLPAVEPRNGAISRLWARATIADLERHAPGAEGAEAITRVALGHNLVSRYTSFIAIDSDTAKGSSHPLQMQQPLEGPEDVSLSQAGGEVMRVPGNRGDALGAPASMPLDEAAPRRGGCAGCASAGASGGGLAGAGLFGLALLVVVRRRRERRR